MRKKKQEKQINYLDLIPVKAEGLKWHKDFRDRVILEVKNEGFFNGIAQKVFNRPEVTKIHLDVHGSYLWPFIDGERTVMDLAALEKEGRVHIIRPSSPIQAAMIERDESNLERIYQTGRADMKKDLEKLKAYLDS